MQARWQGVGAAWVLANGDPKPQRAAHAKATGVPPDLLPPSAHPYAGAGPEPAPRLYPYTPGGVIPTRGAHAHREWEWCLSLIDAGDTGNPRGKTNNV